MAGLGPYTVLLPELSKVGPEPIVVNGVTRGPYKWPNQWVLLGLFHPEISGTNNKPTYNWFLDPS